MIDPRTPIPVLDHGYVKLIDSMGTDMTMMSFSRLEASALKELLSGNKLDDEVTERIWKKLGLAR